MDNKTNAVEFRLDKPVYCYLKNKKYLPPELGSLELKPVIISKATDFQTGLPASDGLTANNPAPDTPAIREDSNEAASENAVVYFSWNLSFKNPTTASRPNNAGKDEIQVIFNLNRTIEWDIENGKEKVVMQPGEVCVFRNNNYQTQMTYSANTEFEFKSIQMSTSYFRSILQKYFPQEKIAQAEAVFLTSVAKTFITAEMYRILLEIDTSDRLCEFKGVFLEGKIIELLALVLYGISHNQTQKISRIPSSSKSDVQKMEDLRSKIQQRPELSYNAEQLAKELCMSQSKLSRLFRSLYGMSLYSYVQEQRLEKAASLIGSKAANVSQAAFLSGYENLSHFSNEFKKRFGVLPREFGR